MNNFSPTYVGAKSDQGPVRSNNEDAYWVSDLKTPTELGALYIVADGVGGQEYGEVAAQQAVQIINERFYAWRQQGNLIQEALERAIHEANLAIYEEAQARGQGRMGCTLVAAVQFEGHLYIAHVGDARAYLLLGNRLRRLTRDDTWVQRQVEAGAMTAAEAEKHELRNVVTQVLGNKEAIDVHLSEPQELYSGDVFLLCSDGLHDVVTKEQLAKLLKYNEPQAAAEALVEAAIKGETRDNVTAVVVNSGVVPGREERPVVARRPLAALPIPLWVMVTLGSYLLCLLFWRRCVFWLLVR